MVLQLEALPTNKLQWEGSKVAEEVCTDEPSDTIALSARGKVRACRRCTGLDAREHGTGLATKLTREGVRVREAGSGLASSVERCGGVVPRWPTMTRLHLA